MLRALVDDGEDVRLIRLPRVLVDLGVGALVRGELVTTLLIACGRGASFAKGGLGLLVTK